MAYSRGRQTPLVHRSLEDPCAESIHEEAVVGGQEGAGTTEYDMEGEENGNRNKFWSIQESGKVRAMGGGLVFFLAKITKETFLR